MSATAPSKPNFLDLLKNKNRKNLPIVKVFRKQETETKAASTSTPPRPQIRTQPKSSTPNGAAVVRNGIPQSRSRQTSSSISRQSSSELRDPTKQIKSQRVKRSSPAVSTPRLTDSDDDEDESEVRRKRVKIERRNSVDTNRRIRDQKAFVEDDQSQRLELIHAADIANSETLEHGKYKYDTFFTKLAGDEDECPTIRLQYPSPYRREKYQLVRPADQTDFRPLSEIMENMKIAAAYYLDDESAEKVNSQEIGSGLVERLQRFAREGDKGKPGAQTKFIETINEYNRILLNKRKDGTISRKLDDMKFVHPNLVEHIVKNQVYARTVSPNINDVRQYEGFSNNVYGELLPKFLSDIFKRVHLKSDQIFVDLGSGVGNCVIQAALETGCESWGCEMMDNCAKLASLQKKEFVPRCRMWGIKPGKVHLIHDNFLTNEKIRSVLKKADVVLINNQAFSPDLNDKLKYVFLDFKEGCQIVSLKCFRDPSHKIKETNINDPINVLRVREMDRFSSMVSWTDDPGKWYLQVKDSSEVREFEKKMNVKAKQNGSH